MDQMQVVDVEDGKDKDFNVSVKNALKLCSPGGEEVHLLCAKKPEQKQRWLRAFADEREQVQHDLETGEQALKSIDLIVLSLYMYYFYPASFVLHQQKWMQMTTRNHVVIEQNKNHLELHPQSYLRTRKATTYQYPSNRIATAWQPDLF